MIDRRIRRAAQAALWGLLSAALAGCGDKPRMRLGYIPTATFGVLFADPQNIGPHAYGLSTRETGGQVYTCRGGMIDIDHVRGAADNTRHFIRTLRRTLAGGKSGFIYCLAGEMSRHRITVIYPQTWADTPNKEAIIDAVAFEAGARAAFHALVWHEVMTWFGTRFAGIEPEFNSAFSWEDNYSNLLGVHLAMEAMRDTRRDYDTAMTTLLTETLRELQVQPRSTAVAAADSVRGDWYTGNLVPDVRMRNFDIGLDGAVTATLIPHVPGCTGAVADALAVPTQEKTTAYGFTITHEILPYVLEQWAIFKAAGSDRLFADVHFPILIEHIIKDASARGYKYDR